MKQGVRGFTLLELLLVVGIAAVLIIAGIVAYNSVKRNMAVNEAVSLVNLILEQTKRMHLNRNFGAIAADLEPLLARSGNLPAKYVNGTQIVTPFNKTGGAVVLLASLPGTFSLDIAMPPAYVPEIASQFDPNQSTQVSFLRYCGTGVAEGDVMPSVVEMSVECGPNLSGAVLNLNIVTE